MRRLALLLAVPLLACEADSSGLGLGEGEDAGAPQDAVVADVGPADAGPSVDAGGAPDTGSGDDAGSPTFCPAAERFGIGARGFTRDGYEGVLIEAPSRPFKLVSTDASRELTFQGPLPEALLNEGIYYARVELYQPFWSEVRVTLWRITSSGVPDALAFVGWSGAFYRSGTVEDVAYAHVPEPCSIRDAPCGEAAGLRLRATVFGDEVSIGVGDGLDAPTYRAYNGGSHYYPAEPQCEDRPEAWTEGWIAVSAPRPVACDQLQRDACIASPRCTLWGSELSDPGYVCVRATGECEATVDVDTCRRNPNCTYDSGACYCPEGAVCACAGGPAPKCRAVCGGFGGLNCPPNRYCDDLDVRVEDFCQPVPDSGGVCEWAPSSCAGAPGREVCACGANAPRTYANDCERRRDGASGPIPGRCPL